MIHYHGGPITPNDAAVALWTARHACVSFARPETLPLAAEVCQSFILDSGAFSIWKQGGQLDVDGYAAWVDEWQHHPGYDFHLIPDVIDGTLEDNLKLIATWHTFRLSSGVPVWHMHEPLDHLKYLVHCASIGIYRAVALGSSGAFAEIATQAWWDRIAEAMGVVCDERGRPKAPIHGLRMLSPSVCKLIPFRSADSTNVAQNIGIDQRWKGTYQPVTKGQRALILAERIERHVAAARWEAINWQAELELIG